MSRWQKGGTPASYEPVLTLSTRREDEGGPSVALQAIEQGGAGKRDELLLLVHGYNNHRLEAEQVYDAFRRHQGHDLDAAVQRRLNDLLADCFWPGDACWPGLLDRVDFLVFKGAMDNADDTARELVAYLLARPGLKRLHFVGHSMGCLIILKVLAALAGRGAGFSVDRVLLMAAAVPVDLLAPGGELRPALGMAARLRVLCSPDDEVLSAAFPFGQLLAGRSMAVPALGRHGDIPACPVGQVDVRLVSNAHHSDYWAWEGDRGSAVARRQSRAEIKAFMNWQPDQARRLIDDRPLVREREVGTARELGDVRELTRRDLGPGYLPG